VWLNGLPTDAAVWRGELFTRTEEFSALAVERIDEWGSVLATALGVDPKYLPGVMRITRPGEQVKAPERRDEVIRDPKQIAAFFR
jgi:hypothetical protein